MDGKGWAACLLRYLYRAGYMGEDGVGEEGDELGPGSLDAQGQGDGGQLLDGVQAQLENQEPG